MKRQLLNSTEHKISATVFVCTLIVIFFTKGPIEGDQREKLQLSDRSDWYGPIPPTLYGEWPFESNWDLTISIGQLIIFQIGFSLMMTSCNKNKGFLATYSILNYVGALFCTQLWRDSSLLAFLILGIGMLKFSLTSLKYRYFLRSISVTALFIAGLCKVVYTPLISFLVIIALFSIKQTKRILRAILLTIVIFASMWALNEKIVSSLQLTQSFPQQQPMILDLASLYCWGTSLQSNNDARLGLEPLKRNGYPSESICSSVEPMGWDTLRTDRPAWQYSSPILPLYQFQDYKNLMSKWKDAIIHNPNEYIQIKLIHSLQVLTMANAIGPRVEREFSQFNLPNLAVAMVSKYTLIARLLDKVRLFSLGALILVLLLTFAWMTGKEARSFNFDLSQFTFIISLLSFAVFQMLIITFAFVSSNGRYSFPFVFIGLILLIIHVTKFKKEVEGPAKFFADN